jgi:hypothetical protein
MSETNLDALLGEAAPPPLPAPGLAARIAAIATAQPQEERPLRARRAAGRDRRGGWLRRPLIGGAIALGIAFSGAVAATLAGVPIPEKVQEALAQLPFVGHKALEEEHPARHFIVHPVPRPAPARAVAPAPVLADDVPSVQQLRQRPAAIRRLRMAEAIVARREAVGLPSPPVEQVQRMIHRRQMMRRWQMATPEERTAFLANHPHFAEMLERRQDRRLAMGQDVAAGPRSFAPRPFAARRFGRNRFPGDGAAEVTPPPR